MIELKQVSKIYNKDTPTENTVFKKFNMKVGEHDFVSIVGSNGSGKTTLINCICGNIEIEHGVISINGTDISRLKDYQRYKYIGRVYQDPKMGTCENLTVLENIALADNKGQRYGLKLCINKKRINFYKEKLCELKMGLEDKLNVPVSSLSGGQRQALALIMATLNDINILILDEHTAALDPKTADIIMKLTDKIIKENNLTALMITHNLKYALQYGNRLIILNNGKIVKDISEDKKKHITQDEVLNIFSRLKMI